MAKSMPQVMCWIKHIWKELWMGERECLRCGKHQYKQDLWSPWGATKPHWLEVEVRETKKGK